MNTWVDFKELRRKLNFTELLRHYGVTLKVKGQQHHGFCPLPNHNGKRNSPSFSANLEKGIFQCFGCGAKGNALDFVVLMEKLDPKRGEDLHKVALELERRFALASAHAPAKPVEPESSETTVVNAPLDFDLKGLDASHPYLPGRGFSAETVSRFGLGYCSRGFLKERIAIPLHDDDGQLVGYAGRVVDDATIGPDTPKYLFPPKRERHGVHHEFKKSLFLYHGHRLTKPVDDLIVVEGFASVWWLVQLGFPNVVGTMGADCSERQAELVVKRVHSSGRVWLVSDGDDAGERGAKSALAFIAPHRFVRWVNLGEDKQPTDYAGDALRLLLAV